VPGGGEAADVQGVVRTAPDGSRAYFVARGVLNEGPYAEGRAPAVGAENLYVYDGSAKSVTFVADICTGPGSSGLVEDVRCPLVSESNDGRLYGTQAEGEAQTAGQGGEFLLFASYGRLTGDDDDAAKDVYLYDAVAGKLERVSVGQEGDDANGNNDAFDATIAPGHQVGGVHDQYEMESRAISEDGSRAVFRTAEPLSSAAINGLTDVYEWRRVSGGSGEVSLISSGSSESADKQATISPSGRDVFFITAQALLPSDTDLANDLYDARVGGGGPPPTAPEAPCSGDGCQGPLTSPSPVLVPGSVVQAAEQKVKPVKRRGAKEKSTKSHKRKKKKKRRATRLARKGGGR
jgi:hypothetical protein